jgi:gliding motility-associated-like protein
LSNGVVFSGYSGSTAPKIYNYGAPTYYGNVLISDNWYNPLRINFTDTSNASIYHLAKKIEFDNIVDYAGEVDFMSIDVYDSVNILIYHYLSASPEHVVLNFTTPMAAYITIDDSAGTAFVVDNILIDYWSPSSKDSNSNTEFFIPNVFTPNNDGQNDFFEIKANGYKSYLLKIYNRWGQLIFSSNNESNYWNGKIKHTNKDASDGTYYYILELINNIDKYSSYKGLLTLLRDK